MEGKDSKTQATEYDKELQAEINSIFAKPVEVSVGGMTFKVVTASIGELPVIEELLQEYNKVMAKNKYQVNEAVGKVMATIIRKGIEKYHPKWNEETIRMNIPYEFFPDFIKAITGNENFIKKMQEIGGVNPLVMND